jgi:hypothetical protein
VVCFTSVDPAYRLRSQGISKPEGLALIPKVRSCTQCVHRFHWGGRGGSGRGGLHN